MRQYRIEKEMRRRKRSSSKRGERSHDDASYGQARGKKYLASANGQGNRQQSYQPEEPRNGYGTQRPPTNYNKKPNARMHQDDESYEGGAARPKIKSYTPP